MSDNESEYDDDDDGDDNEDVDDNEDIYHNRDGDDKSDESEKLTSSHCGKETGHIVYFMKCRRCSGKDFYWSKDAQCMICNWFL